MHLRGAVSGDDRLFYWIESPRMEHLARSGTQRFSGWVLWYGDRLVTELEVAVDGGPPAAVPVDHARDEIARNAAGAPGAARCGFDSDLEMPAGASRLSIAVRYADGARAPFLDVDLAALRRHRDDLDGIAERADRIPLPDADLVHLTQGLHDPDFYRSTIVPAALNTAAFLDRAGRPATVPARVLDFGCGTGRLLAGWHALDKGHALHGCDINEELVRWAQANLPREIDVRSSQPAPPLPYADSTFDVAFAVSVFTHLSLESQRQWVDELRRVLRPGGVLLVTAHGESYLPLIFPDRADAAAELRSRGHLVTAVGEEGSNRFASAHTRAFARRLFRGFDLAGFFPNGRIGGRRLPYPVFILQDVYVFNRLP